MLETFAGGFGRRVREGDTIDSRIQRRALDPSHGWLAMASASSRGSRVMPNYDITVIANGVWPKRVAPCRQSLFAQTEFYSPH